MRAPDKAKLSSRTMATITAATRTVYPYEAGLSDVCPRATEQLDEAIAHAAMVAPPGQRRELR